MFIYTSHGVINVTGTIKHRIKLDVVSSAGVIGSNDRIISSPESAFLVCGMDMVQHANQTVAFVKIISIMADAKGAAGIAFTRGDWTAAMTSEKFIIVAESRAFAMPLPLADVITWIDMPGQFGVTHHGQLQRLVEDDCFLLQANGEWLPAPAHPNAYATRGQVWVLPPSAQRAQIRYPYAICGERVVALCPDGTVADTGHSGKDKILLEVDGEICLTFPGPATHKSQLPVLLDFFDREEARKRFKDAGGSD